MASVTVRASSGSPVMRATGRMRAVSSGARSQPEQGRQLGVAVLLDHVDALVALHEVVHLAAEGKARTRR